MGHKITLTDEMVVGHRPVTQIGPDDRPDHLPAVAALGTSGVINHVDRDQVVDSARVAPIETVHQLRDHFACAGVSIVTPRVQSSLAWD